MLTDAIRAYLETARRDRYLNVQVMRDLVSKFALTHKEAERVIVEHVLEAA